MFRIRLFFVVVGLCAPVASLPAHGLLQAQTAAAPVDPERLRQEYVAAQAAQQRGDLNEAAAAYRAFLAQAQTELAEGYVLGGDAARATPLLDAAVALDRAPEMLLQAARASLVAGQLDRANALAEEIVRDAPLQKETLAGAHQVLGRVLLKQQQDGEARKQFEAAIALDPTFPNGYDLAVSCLDLGDESCAAQLFAEMERSFGDKAELHVAFGKAYGNSDFQPRAIAEFRRAIAEEPKRPGTHYLLAAVLLATGGDESARVEAQRELNAELQISPHDALSYATLGQIALVRTDYPRAVELLKKAILYGPQLPEGYLYLGQAYFNLGRPDEAEEPLRECIRLTQDVSRNRYQVQKAHYLLGRILSQRHEAEAAHAEMQISRELADKALAQDKSRLAGVMDSAHAATVQVEIPAADGSNAMAARVVDPQAETRARALEAELRPALADAYNNLGVLAATRNDFAEATGDFRNAAAWDATLEGLDYNWGRAAFAGNLYAEAVAPLTRYVAAHPDDTGARSVLALSEFQTSQYQECIDALQPIAARTELAAQVRFVYAESLVKTGRVDEGIERLSQLAAANPGVGEIQRALAEARALQAKTAPQKP